MKRIRELATAPPDLPGAYDRIIEGIFFSKYAVGAKELNFTWREAVELRDELDRDVGVSLPDLLYSFSSRRALPERVLATQEHGLRWAIERVARGQYRFFQTPICNDAMDEMVAEIENSLPDDVEPATPAQTNRYKTIIERIFSDRYTEGATEVAFERADIVTTAAALGVDLPQNLGDVVYAIRYRIPMPDAILATQPEKLEWIIEGAGRAKYKFRLVPATRIRPNETLVSIDIPDGTPELIRAYALDDEQALLAIVRYNRLIDIFLGLTASSLQNHLRTTVKGIGQIEIDELYVGLDKRGCHYVIPVQAKGGKDQIGVVQTTQDIRYADQKFPGLRCRPIAAQFMDGGKIALFELTLQEGEVRLVDEKHYRLVPADKLDRDAIRDYRE